MTSEEPSWQPIRLLRAEPPALASKGKRRSVFLAALEQADEFFATAKRSECARIWNPIHTDKAVAFKAGLPDIILHGTANLAYGVSAVVAELANHRSELVRRVACRFAAMVLLPSTITVRIWPAN